MHRRRFLQALTSTASGLVLATIADVGETRKRFWQGWRPDFDARRHAIKLFGASYVGLDLPTTAQSQEGGDWDAVYGWEPPGGIQLVEDQNIAEGTVMAVDINRFTRDGLHFRMGNGLYDVVVDQQYEWDPWDDYVLGRVIDSDRKTGLVTLRLGSSDPVLRLPPA